MTWWTKNENLWVGTRAKCVREKRERIIAAMIDLLRLKTVQKIKKPMKFKKKKQWISVWSAYVLQYTDCCGLSMVLLFFWIITQVLLFAAHVNWYPELWTALNVLIIIVVEWHKKITEMRVYKTHSVRTQVGTFWNLLSIRDVSLIIVIDSRYS